jgi:hypothetical protein
LNIGGNGGNGVASTITGSSVTRAGGGGGTPWEFSPPGNPGTQGLGGSGGGGNGGASNTGSGTAGIVNTGSGGGGGANAGTGGAGGSGVVIISYPSTFQLTGGAGLTFSTAIVGANRVTTFTAGTGSIGFQTIPVGAYQLLETVVLTSSQASVEFTNLAGKYSADYKHLQIRGAIRAPNSGTFRMFLMRFNGDTAANYSSHLLYSDGPGSLSDGTKTSMWWSYSAAGSSPANAFGGVVTDILDAFETTKNKQIRTLGGGPNGYNLLNLVSGSWRNTSAVTSITLLNQDGDGFAAGSRISIYGIRGS